MPIQAPKLTPATQVVSASGWIDWTQSSADAASLSSPMPLSNMPWLLPTPRKLKRRVAKPRRTKVLVEQLHDLVVHRAPGLRVRMQDQGDRRAGARSRMETAFETAFGAGKNDFGHGWGSLAIGCGADARAGLLYRGAHHCGNRQFPAMTTASISTMRRPRRSFRKRGQRSSGSSWRGPIPARPMPRDAARGPCLRKRGRPSPRNWVGVMTSFSPAARASGRDRRGASEGAAAHGATEHAIVHHAMGAGSTIIPVGPDGLDRRGGARRGAGRRAGAGRDPAGQQRDRDDPAARPARAERIREAGSLLLADCAQSAGKLDFPTPISSPCAPTSSAARRGSACCWSGISHAGAVGGQEKGYRRGTQDAPNALAFAAALAARPSDDMERLAVARPARGWGQAAGGVVVGEDAPRSPTIGAVALPGVGARLLVQFDLAGIAVSAGSACARAR